MMCVNTLLSICFAKGMDAPLPAAGLTTMELFAELMPAHFLLMGGGQSMAEDGRNKAVARLTMEMLKTPGKVPEPLMGAPTPASVHARTSAPAWQNLNLSGVAIAIHSGGSAHPVPLGVGSTGCGAAVARAWDS